MGSRLDLSCLKPEIDDNNNLDNNSEYKIMNNNEKRYKRFSNKEVLYPHSNKFYSFNNRKNFENRKSKTYLDKIKTLQKYVRFCIAIKKFNERIDLLTNILELDSSVNVIKDKKTEFMLLKNNIGEQISLQLTNSRQLPLYIYTRYYRMNINKYKPNRYLIKTPLTYIDKYKNNDLYIGTWTLEKKFYGYGIFYTEGNKYEGFWNFGKLSGESRIFYQNKDYYIGDILDGDSNGFGKYYHNEGTIYEGNWLNNHPHGEGKEIFRDGSKFVGTFENGYKKKGKFTWVDGCFYDGEINNNCFEGYGKFRWKEGRVYIGFWKNGKMHGKGTMNYIDGAKYEGEFMDGKRHGKGNYIWNKNKYYKGNWIKGKQEGDGYFYNKGKGIIGVWKDGKIKQCLSEKINNELILNIKINDERPPSPSDNFENSMNGRSEYYYDSINLSTNLSNNSLRDVRLNKTHINNNQKNKTEIKKKIQSSKLIYNKKSITDISVISDYTSNKPKITNIDILFKNNSNISRSKKSIISKNFENTTTWKNGNIYQKYKKKK